MIPKHSYDSHQDSVDYTVDEAGPYLIHYWFKSIFQINFTNSNPSNNNGECLG